jgi:hypothetical protein
LIIKVGSETGSTGSGAAVVLGVGLGVGLAVVLGSADEAVRPDCSADGGCVGDDVQAEPTNRPAIASQTASRRPKRRLTSVTHRSSQGRESVVSASTRA